MSKRNDVVSVEEPASKLPRWLSERLSDCNWRDITGSIVATGAVVAVLTNVLFMQSGQHPAPMFKSLIAPITPAAPALATATARPPEPPSASVTATLPRPRPTETLLKGDTFTKADPAARSDGAPRGDLLVRPRAVQDVTADIQRELARKGYFDGAVDGRYGPKTDAAIRDFEHAAGLKPATEPTESLLRMIKAAPAKSAAKPPATVGAKGAALHADPIADVLGTSGRILALQRALADFGYAQIKPTGVMDPETKAAIERFERERKFPITGAISDRILRELASLTGGR